ncbi:protein-L-isoaspartate(D-aspartate) O-methyltransferase [Halochromatium glycolicum]
MRDYNRVAFQLLSAIQPILMTVLVILSLGAGDAMAMNPNRPPGDSQSALARQRLVAEVEREVRATSAYLGFDQLDPRVLSAIGSVPRERFVPPAMRSVAYRNAPLPIGGGQTISQPYIVAVMSHLLNLPSDGGRVYELGTGSGYQAAVLGEMGAEVYSVEIVPELAERSAELLKSLGYDNVHIRAGDGYRGWPEAAPFDAVIVTAAGPEIPAPLAEQLKVGGRLVMPLGPTGQSQELVVLTKQQDGTLKRRKVLPVRFVPITGDSVDD